jgi:hypothetical protein
MKRLLPALALLAVFSFPVLAGDINSPGYVPPPPPPCVENCPPLYAEDSPANSVPDSSTATSSTMITSIVLALVQALAQ